MKKVLLIISALILSACSSQKEDDIDAKIDVLLGQMTVNEKVGQLCCPIGFNFYDKIDDSTVTLNESFLKMWDTLQCGGFYGVLRADPWSEKTTGTGLDERQSVLIFNEMQRYVMEHSRLGIPVYFAEECVHGHMAVGADVYPSGLCQAATWDEDLLYAVGDAVGASAASRGAKFAYGPVMDITRDPRWSRVEESLGEDPYLSGTLGTAIMKGMQNHLASTLKHFSSFGVSEGGHHGSGTSAGKREILSELNLNFETAVKNGAKSIMTSYNTIDGIPCSSNTWLLKDILRERWGFNGVVFSDLGSIWALHSTHRTAENQLDATAQAINAGVDIDLGASNYGAYLEEAVSQGLVSMKTLDDAVRRVLRFKFETGLFDNPYLPIPIENQAGRNAKNLPLQVAREGIVLLKNDGILPLSKDVKNIAVIGPNADNTYNQLGDYTAPQNPDDIITVLEGIRSHVSSTTTVTYAKGCSVRDTADTDFDAALKAAKNADAVVLVVGGSSARNFKTSYKSTDTVVVDGHVADMDCGEGYDRATISLSGLQDRLIEAVAATGKPLVIVFIEGRPLLKNTAVANGNAVMTAFYPGQEGGNAIADVIFGDYNPAGRLPMSQPRSVGQVPVFYSQPKQRDYIDCQSSPLFPFGYGLSYTNFDYNNMNININPDYNVLVSVDVRNTGDREGDEVVQLYIRDEFASSAPPEKLLKNFKRVFIQRGETKTVTFSLKPRDFSTLNNDLEWEMEPGDFTIMVGASSDDIRVEQKIRL
ncbi:MAG: glycoside hydrolase family 3 C-terminal domain-containing protein [Bacteroidales bacterium]|nr:glycoside hydrolase family 3 C-terminal domain-containing protein [Bacteroidales bacterium]